MIEVCTQCGNYAQEALGLCGDCLYKEGKQAADYDPVLIERKAIRESEIKSGKLDLPSLEMAVLTAHLAKLDRGEVVVEPGMRKLDPEPPQ